WAKYLAIGGGTMAFSYHALIYLVLAASAMGFGYAAWNAGILHGNVTVLAGASYFIPVLSPALEGVVGRPPRSPSFWQGAGMVCIGASLCWFATRARPRGSAQPGGAGSAATPRRNGYKRRCPHHSSSAFCMERSGLTAGVPVA